jgi:hypothetical protein
MQRGEYRMLKSDKLTPLIYDLEKNERNLTIIENMLNREDTDEFVHITGKGVPTPIAMQITYRGGSLCLTDEIGERLMKDLHSILKVEANKLQKDISKKLGVNNG